MTATSTSALGVGTWGGMWGSGLVGLAQVCVEWVEWVPVTVGVTQVGAEWVVVVVVAAAFACGLKCGWFVRSTRCARFDLVGRAQH